MIVPTRLRQRHTNHIFLRLYQGPSASILVGPDRVLFTAPKALLCQHSKFFSAALNSSFKEAADNEVPLPTHDPEVFKHVLHYMFSGELGFVMKDGKIDTNNLIVVEKASHERIQAVCWTLCHVFWQADALMMDNLAEHVSSVLSHFFQDVER